MNAAVSAASLGVPTSYWMDITVCALFANQIEIAKECLAMVGNIRVLKILGEIKH